MKPSTVIIILLLSICTSCVSTQNTKYKEGQTWNYKTRIGEENSRVTIRKIDREESFVTYHVSLDGLLLPSKTVNKNTIPYTVVTEESLNNSVTNLSDYKKQSKTLVLDDYLQWKKGVKETGTIAYNVPLKDVIDYHEQDRINSKTKKANKLE